MHDIISLSSKDKCGQRKGGYGSNWSSPHRSVETHSHKTNNICLSEHTRENAIFVNNNEMNLYHTCICAWFPINPTINSRINTPTYCNMMQ